MANTYWQDRMAESMARISNKSIKEIEKQMTKFYATAMKHTIAEFEAVYDKLLASMEEGKEPTANDLYKLDRYWKMQAQTRDELRKLGDKQTAMLSKRFEENFFEVYYSILQDSAVAFSTIDSAAVQQIINQVWVADGKSWSRRIWGNIEKLQETLSENLIDCVVTGKKTSELKALLRERFTVSYSQADSLVRTEISHIQTEAAKKRYKDVGIQMVEIFAPKDERRCPQCRKLHGKKYPVGAVLPVPRHPRCRCTVLPIIE